MDMPYNVHFRKGALTASILPLCYFREGFDAFWFRSGGVWGYIPFRAVYWSVR